MTLNEKNRESLLFSWEHFKESKHGLLNFCHLQCVLSQYLFILSNKILFPGY